MADNFILPLDSPNATLAQVGGKGANLAILARAGFPVPPAFLITTAAYRHFVVVHDLQPRILLHAQQASDAANDVEAQEAAAQHIRELFMQAATPPALLDDIRAAYATLNPDQALAVAVRSSATAEDLPNLSFAGQQDTYLNIIGIAALADAVKACWASLWTARAISYRARAGIAQDDVALSVVVQAMIRSESSGVLFTANPLTGNRDEIVIDASFGLGEAIVSGQVEPDHFVLAKGDGQIVKRRQGAKAIAILPSDDAAGGTHIHARSGDAWSLNDAQVRDLAQLGQRVADHFGAPQDIEWAWANGRLALLQSRPITSLYPLVTLPADIPESREKPRIYFSFNSIQGVTDPLTPVAQDVFRLLIGVFIRHVGIQRRVAQVLLEAGERLYVDVTDLTADPRTRRIYLTMMTAADPGAREAILQLERERRLPSQKKVLTPQRVLVTLRGLAPMVLRGARTMLAPQRGIDQAMSGAQAALANSRAITAQAQTLADLIAAMETDLAPALWRLINLFGRVMLPGFICQRLIAVWLREWLGESANAALPLTRSLPDNVTTTMDLRLWQVAQAIRNDPASRDAFDAMTTPALIDAFHRTALPAIAQEDLAQFLHDYGMRGAAEIDMGRQRWQDDPTTVVETLRSYLQIDAADAAPDVVFEKGRTQADAAMQTYVDRIRRLPLGGLRARAFAFVYGRMRALSGFRETPKFFLVQALDVYRRALLKFGAELHDAGIFAHADDVFFVPLATLRAFALGENVDVKAIVAARRTLYAREQHRRQMPRILLDNGEAFFGGVAGVALNADDAGREQLVGQAVSPGVVEGNVRVVVDPRHAGLLPGEILVCPATDPSWTPLFLSAAGLVMELGGMITHGSVVAREYGIPAVVGVHEAALRLHTGQRIRVDGGRGVITVLTQK